MTTLTEDEQTALGTFWSYVGPGVALNLLNEREELLARIAMTSPSPPVEAGARALLIDVRDFLSDLVGAPRSTLRQARSLCGRIHTALIDLTYGPIPTTSPPTPSAPSDVRDDAAREAALDEAAKMREACARCANDWWEGSAIAFDDKYGKGASDQPLASTIRALPLPAPPPTGRTEAQS